MPSDAAEVAMSLRRRIGHVLALLLTIAVLFAGPVQGAPSAQEPPDGAPQTNVVRFAQFNASVNRGATGALLSDLATPDNQQLKNVAEIIQRTNPDVLLINEFDYDRSRDAVRLFQRNYLGVSQNGAAPVSYPQLHPSNPGQSLVIGALKNGGLDVYDTRGRRLQVIEPDDIRYNNVDVAYEFELAGGSVDLAVATDRRNDLLAIWAIDPRTRQLTNVTAPDAPLVFTPAGGESNGETTAYGLALYRSVATGALYAFVTQREANKVAQLELFDANGKVSYRTVRTIELPFEGDLEDAQSEGMVADSELGALYIGQENVGFWKFDAEPNGGATGTLVVAVDEDGGQVQADVEGLTIYKTADGGGYLLVSSQGDSTFAVYERGGANAYLGSFSVGSFSSIDAVQQSDGAQVVSAAVGRYFPRGMLVVHDGLNDPPLYVEDDGEIENASTSFKYVRWERVARALGLERGPQPVDPR